MLVNPTKLKERFNLNVYDPYMVLDVEHMNYLEDRTKFSYSIEVLNVINTAVWINKTNSNFHSIPIIQTDIFYQAISVILNDTAFTDEQLIMYYESHQKIHYFMRTFQKFTDSDSFGWSLEIDFLLFGMFYDIYKNLDKGVVEYLHENYCDILNKILDKNCEISEGVILIRELIDKS